MSQIAIIDNDTQVARKGRPSEYNQTIANLICHLTSINTCGIKELCRRYPELPNHDTINEWRFRHDSFAGQYARAKQQQVQLLVDEINDISDDSSQDVIYDENGNPRCNNEYIARSRLRVDTRKWLASKLLPKLYGDKVQSEVTIVVKHEDALGALE